LPASAAAPLALWAHLRTRRYREDLGFADRRWRFPKAALASGLALWIIFPANDPAWTLSLLPVLALIIGSWCEHARETGRARG
jgi:hypothetical protein